MSTKIQSVYANPGEDRGLRIERQGCHVSVMAERGAGRTVTIPDFLAAVEAECGVRIVPADAIVIDRAECPVMTSADGAAALLRAHRGIYRPHTTEEMQATRDYALALLSAVDYLDAHPPTPPVDEADVEALAGLIRHDPQWFLRRDQGVARRLLATGRVSVTR